MQNFASDYIHVESAPFRFPLQRHMTFNSDFWPDRIPEFTGHKLGGFVRTTLRVGGVNGRVDAKLAARNDFDVISGAARNDLGPLPHGAAGQTECAGDGCSGSEMTDNRGFEHAGSV